MESGNSNTPPLCAMGCGFFGSPETQSLCSKCYKVYLKVEEEPSKSLNIESSTITSPGPEDPSTSTPNERTSLSASEGSSSTTAGSEPGLSASEDSSSTTAGSEPGLSAYESSSSTTTGSEPGLSTSVGSSSTTTGSEPGLKAKIKKKRCESCNKKVGLMGFACRCGMVLCGAHRYPKEHSCTFDFKTFDRQVLIKQNPLLRADKLEYRI